MQEMSPQICVDPGLTGKARMAPVLTELGVMSCGHKFLYEPLKRVKTVHIPKGDEAVF